MSDELATFTIQIGNSDDKLPQAMWAAFVDQLSDMLDGLNVDIHFFGYSSPGAAWQNCCAVFNAPREIWYLSAMQELLSYMATAFNQDSIAVTIGKTVFVEARTS